MDKGTYKILKMLIQLLRDNRKLNDEYTPEINHIEGWIEEVAKEYEEK